MYWCMDIFRKRESSHRVKNTRHTVGGGVIKCFGGYRITCMDAAQQRAKAVARKGGELES